MRGGPEPGARAPRALQRLIRGGRVWGPRVVLLTILLGPKLLRGQPDACVDDPCRLARCMKAPDCNQSALCCQHLLRAQSISDPAAALAAYQQAFAQEPTVQLKERIRDAQARLAASSTTAPLPLPAPQADRAPRPQRTEPRQQPLVAPPRSRGPPRLPIIERRPLTPLPPLPTRAAAPATVQSRAPGAAYRRAWFWGVLSAATVVSVAAVSIAATWPTRPEGAAVFDFTGGPLHVF